LGDGPRGVDQPDVAERLREVPDHLAAGRVDLLGQEADIVDSGHGTLERRGGGLDLTGQRLRLRQPERAQQERPLLTGEAVTGPVSVHQPPLVSEPLSDGIDGRFHPQVIVWQESGAAAKQTGGTWRDTSESAHITPIG
jgi:hypothetical protein